MNLSTKTIATVGLLVALSVVFTIFSYMFAIEGVGSVRLGLRDLPIMISGVLFGPFVGGITGILSDLIGYFIAPKGPYLFQLTIITILYGVIPALLWRLKFIKNDLAKIALFVIVSRILNQILILPFVLSFAYKIPYMTVLLSQSIGQLILIPVFIFLAYLLIKALKTAKVFNF